MLDFSHLKETDAEVYNSVIKEYERQQNGLELIASEIGLVRQYLKRKQVITL